MLFSSLVFLFMFFPIVISLYYLAKDNLKNYILLAASIIFYAWGEPVYVWLMILAIIINYIFGFWVDINRIKNEKKRKLNLIICIIINISILFIFKYYMFVVENVNLLFNKNIKIIQIALPLGISFYTFQALSYVIDVYRGEVKLQKNILNLGLYISLFPQLVAGPIVRYETIENEICSRVHSSEKFANGVRRFVIGLGKKIIISNQVALVADNLFALQTNELSVATTWLAIIAYTLQIFFDFSGYSDMAIGLGKMFGFEFLENFNYPYIAESITEFWRRWHISLGTWFRDYVYIPLGGNRCSNIKNLRNILIVWLLTGFWHGASWTFIAWGVYYGILLISEKKILNKYLKKLWRPLRHLYVVMFVMIGWIFFRADNFSYSVEFIKNMFMLNGVSLIDNNFIIYLRDYWYIFILGILFSTPIFNTMFKFLNNKCQNISNNKIIWILESFMYCSIFCIVIMHLMSSSYNPFIYFRF